MGHTVQAASDTRIEIAASLYDAARLNLMLRTGVNVLCLLKRFSCEGPDELYREAVSFPWEDYIAPSEYLSIISHVDTPTINNSVFAGQKLKDAIVDRVSEKCGSRPNSGPGRDNVVINLYWNDDRCWIYLQERSFQTEATGKFPMQPPCRRPWQPLCYMPQVLTVRNLW